MTDRSQLTNTKYYELPRIPEILECWKQRQTQPRWRCSLQDGIFWYGSIMVCIQQNIFLNWLQGWWKLSQLLQHGSWRKQMASSNNNSLPFLHSWIQLQDLKYNRKWSKTHGITIYKYFRFACIYMAKYTKHHCISYYGTYQHVVVCLVYLALGKFFYAKTLMWYYVWGHLHDQLILL